MEKWLDPKTITLWIIIIAGLVLLLAFSLITLAYLGVKRIVQTRLKEAQLQLDHQKKLLETSIFAQEKERIRIAADLHDSLIGKLTSIRLQHQLNYDSGTTDHLLGETIAEARRISHDLSPPLIEYKTLSELVEEILLPWKKNFALFLKDDVRTDEVLSVDVKIQFTRILQELITNISKHAGADQLQVHLRHTQKWLMLSIKDNGCGFDPEKIKKGLGFYNIELRMQHLEGHYHITSVNKKGSSALFILHHTKFNKP